MKNPRFVLPACLLALSFLATIASAATAPADLVVLENVTSKPSEVIKLWPGLAPGEKEGAYGPEQIVPERPRPFDQITNVTVPTLSVFLPKPEKNTGTSMLVIPGGGLDRLAIETEGYEIVEWLNQHGIAAFLLKYRVPARDPQAKYKVGLQDAQRAMGIIRSRAADWRIDPDSVGSIGFSAGAEINVMLSTYHADPRMYDPVDAADKFSFRPDFNIPIYGGGFATRDALRPDIASRINATTPPMFIAHAFDDAAMSSIILIGALKRANIPAEIHIFGAGGHGFGVRDTGLPLGQWDELCLNWLAWQGFLDAAPLHTFARDVAQARSRNPAALPSLSSVMPKADLTQAFAAQRRLVRLALKDGAQVAGYKAAYATPAAQKAAKVKQPVHGVLFKSGRIDVKDGKPVAVKTSQPLLVETEIGYVMATDIGTKLRVPRQAVTTVESIVPVIELPFDAKTANAKTKAFSAIDTVAGNVGSNQFIVGAPLSPKVVGFTDALVVTLNHDGKKVDATTGADVKDGQAQMLMTLINQIIDQGRVIHRGDIIISGALGGAAPGEKGSYAADFGKLGNIAFTIE